MNLPDNVNEHRPNPLGEAVQAASRSEQGSRNIGVVADELAILSCDKGDLPPALREARERLEESGRLRAQAEAGVRAGLTLWQNYQSALGALDALRTDLAAGEQALGELRAVAETLAADFDRSWAVELRSRRFGVILNRITQAQAAREGVKLLPRTLDALRARIGQAAAAVASLERQHGFKPPTTSPAIPAPEAQAEEPRKVYAFRAEQ
jgi:hypothetical protein